MPRCEICGDTGFYRIGRSHKRCDCGTEPRRIPEGCHPFIIDADSSAADEMRRRVWMSEPGLEVDRIPASVIDQIAHLLRDCGARFVLCWEESGNLHTIRGHDGVVLAGPSGGHRPQYEIAVTLRRAAHNLRRALFEFGNLKVASVPEVNEDTLEAAQADETCSRHFQSAKNLEREMFSHVNELLELHTRAIQLRETKAKMDQEKPE